MTPEQAIERLLKIAPDSRPLSYADDMEAIRLGIEALKQLLTEREKHVGFWKDRLPSETKE